MGFRRPESAPGNRQTGGLLSRASGCTSGDRPINPVVETPKQVRDRVLEAAEFIPAGQLGSCGFAAFGHDTSTSARIAFAKIAARASKEWTEKPAACWYGDVAQANRRPGREQITPVTRYGARVRRCTLLIPRFDTVDIALL